MSPASGFDEAYKFVVAIAARLWTGGHPYVAEWWATLGLTFLCVAFVFFCYALPALLLLLSGRELLKVCRNWPAPRSYDDWRP